MEDRYFYHSFPRRGANTDDEIAKGCKILKSIFDYGLLLTPEHIEWKQSTLDQPRTFPYIQKRVCFTELSPLEILEHSNKFGRFSLEFDTTSIRQLGAIPVFYIPQPIADSSDGSDIGSALIAILMDLNALTSYMSTLNELLSGKFDVPEDFGFKVNFTRTPENTKHFSLNRDHTKKFLSALGHQITPWFDLHSGTTGLLNFFYPTDNTKRDSVLEYYRQREWRIACNFTIKIPGQQPLEVMHVPKEHEKRAFLDIDKEFFSRSIKTDLGDKDTLNESWVFPGINNKKIIEFVRRVIVPKEAFGFAQNLFSGMKDPLPIITLDELNIG